MAIVTTFRTWRSTRSRIAMMAKHHRPVEHVARLAPEWGIVEVRRTMDATNTGPFMGWPSQ
ncbi:MAG: hypothetical protein H0V86_10220 [Chloroflexia bacterium]|nr:hypothetical protein [Chloroflexia bacterium]